MPADLTALPDVGLDELEQLELTVDIGLGAALDALVELRRRQAHLHRGFALWHEYLLARFGEAISRLRLPEGERLALVESMSTPTAAHRGGMPVRAQASVLGVSPGTVQTDKRALGLAPERRPRPKPLPAPAGKVHEQAAEWVRRHRAGLTLAELAKVAGWSEGKASGALTDCRRRGTVARTDDRRNGMRIHVGAPVEPAGDDGDQRGHQQPDEALQLDGDLAVEQPHAERPQHCGEQGRRIAR